MTGNIFTELAKGFQRMRTTSEIERQAIHAIMAAFYNNDYLYINDILKAATLNNPYSQETLNKLMFQHLDVTKKILNRLSSGIYTAQPTRELIMSDDKVDPNLNPLLRKLKYSQKVKDAFRKALYFNTVFATPVWDYQLKSMRLDVITPDNVEVETKDNHLILDTIKIKKARPDGTVYHSVWTETEHYIIDGENKLPPENNPDGKNPFGKLPFSILRIEEGCDFYGEPNWNLFLNQKNLDIRLTDMNESELRTVLGVFHGINTNFEEGISLSANKILQSQEREGERVSLEPVNLNIDYEQIKDNIDWKMKAVMNSEGLSSQSGSTDTVSESGIKRSMDEVELQERRDDFKEILYNFEIDLLQNIRMVNNAYQNPKLNDKAYFEVTFSEEKATETIQDKILRRDMEKQIGYKNNISFTMEDLEVSEEEAIIILNNIQKQNKLIEPKEVTTPPEPVNDNEDDKL